MFKLFLRDESGATAIEYVLIAVAMAAAIVAGFPLITSAMTVDMINVGNDITNIGLK